MKHIEIYGNRKKLIMASWILAGCLVIAVNGYAFMSVLANPIPDPSREVRTARMKYSSFHESADKKLTKIDEKIWQAFNRRFGNKKELVKPALKINQKPAPLQTVYETIRLPELSGILTIQADNAETTYLAVLNGRSCVEKEEIDGFKIDQINEAKVLLERNGRQFEIDAPDVKYSLSHNQ